MKKKTQNKRQLLHEKSREKRKRNISDFIHFMGFTVIAVVVGLVGCAVYEWYANEYKPMKEIVVDVNGTEFDMAYYIEMLTYVCGDYTSYASYYTSYALSYIEYYELVAQEAEALGYTVTEEEITAEIESYGYDDTQVVRDTVRANLLLVKMEDEYFDSLVPTSAEQSYLLAMFLESEEQTEEVKDRMEAGEAFTDIAAELSLDSTTQEVSGDLNWLPEGVIDDILDSSVMTDDLISEAEVGVLYVVEDADASKDVGYWIMIVTATETVTDEDTEEETQTATVKAILVGSEAEAEEVMALLDAGEDFDTVAEEYSATWDDDEGSVLEVEEGDYSDVFEAYALDPDVEIDAVSEIIRDTETSTDIGYWLYEVTGRGTQDISDDNRTILIEDELNDWLDALDYTDVIEYLDDDMESFAVDKVTG